jgi:methyltransferase (TIGR00027 family)
MREDRPSTTALRVAVRRAAHQLLDSPRVFEDPLALAIIGTEQAAKLSTPEESENRASRFRAFMAVRSRFAEDELARAVAWGTRQYVILGAGLDTFAYRNPFPDLRVFEVDHPATQAWKRHRLEAAAIALPESLTFVPVDFQKQTFVDGLRGAGFELREAAFFSWLGVTPYLPSETVLATLKSIVSLSPQNGVAFDFAVPRSSLDQRSHAGFDFLASRVAAAGEPFQGFFEPAELVRQLGDMGFGHVEDLDADAINARYFKDRQDGLRVSGALGHLICARG